MKKNMTALAMTVAVAAGTMGYMVNATAGTADYSATLTVVSDNTCDLSVTPPGSSDYNATWTATDDGNGGLSSTMAVDNSSPKEPLEILVSIAGGTNCAVNNINIETDSTGATQVPGDTYSWLHAVTGSSGGYWRFVPTMASIKLYEDDAGTTGESKAVKFHAADGQDYDMNATAQAASGASTTMENGIDGVQLTASYIRADYKATLLSSSGRLTSILPDDQSKAYKSVKLGIGAVVASDPESASGGVAKESVTSGNSVDIPMVVTVSQG